jgi:peroxiredoxin
MATVSKRLPLAPGTRAPRFRLPVSLKQSVALEDQAGKPVVLIFYPLDWSPVCSDELAIYTEVMPELTRFGAAVFGISVDSVYCHQAFAAARNYRVPLLADFHPKGAVSRLYNAFREEDGFSERALYVIDGAGTIFWSHISPVEVNPGADGVFDALERLTGGSTQAEAHP